MLQIVLCSALGVCICVRGTYRSCWFTKLSVRSTSDRVNINNLASEFVLAFVSKKKTFDLS